MRFDEVSAQYADFGEFYLGLQLPLDEMDNVRADESVVQEKIQALRKLLSRDCRPNKGI
jgi:hypothetical protein